MALINCKECEKEISEKAKKCPHCGIKNTKKSGCLTFIVALVLFFGFMSIIGNLNSSSENKTDNTNFKTQVYLGSENLNSKNKTIVKVSAFTNIEKLKSKLSKNGIGNLGMWKNDFLGWTSFTNYYQFGNESSINGLKNNIAYYIESDDKNYAEIIKIVLNINNSSERRKALNFLNTISRKTFKSLELNTPRNLSDNILTGKNYKFENSIFITELILNQSKIETWKIIIKTK